MKEKHYFASANTGKGFVNYFNYINEEGKDGYLYILKGGPGTGKSTLMKKVGEYFFRKGYNIDYFHCSSDVDSLDGVRLRDFNIAIVDGTAPHVTEASMPEIKERIINLGEFIGEDVAKHKEEIEKLLDEKKKCYAVAYKYISAIYNIYQIEEILNTSKKKSIKLSKLKRQGSERKLFYGAITNKGNKTFIDERDYQSVKKTNGSLNETRDSLIARGYELEVFYNNIMPEKIEAIWVKDSDLLIKMALKSTKGGQIGANREIVSKLLCMVGEALIGAKKQHKKIEKFYIENMNFEGLDMITGEIIEDIKNRI